ncbi:MAG: DegV family protein [Oscillospiraceae bacterium]|nr:DegV family protein [Oscillospiraceae bacterium]
MKTKIIIDSTTNVKAHLAECFEVVPLTVHFGEEEYTDGVTISHRQFYTMLEQGDVVPTTSQPTPDAFAQKYKKVTDGGCEAVVITVASGLSGTYQSATIAAQDFAGRVFVVDSGSVAIGAGILAEIALEMANQGKTAREIVHYLEQIKGRVKILAVLDTLEYLKKGGRVSRTVAFAGGLLNIKPVAVIENGEIKMAGKARGNKLGNAVMLQQISSMGGIDCTKPFILGYTGVTDTLLQEFVQDNADYFGDCQLHQSCVGSVVGTHAGPDAIAVAFVAG